MKRLGYPFLLMIILVACSQKSPSHFFKNGSAQYQLKNYSVAIENLDEAIELNDHYKEAYYLRALCYVKLDKTDKALVDFNKAIELDTTYKEAYFNRAFYIKDQLGDYAGSIRDYNHYIRLNAGGDNAYALNNRGFAKYKQNDPEGALTDIRASLDSDPSNAFAYKNLALVFLAMDSLEQACQNLQLALDHDYTSKYDDEVNQLIEANCKP
ncbi:MAG: tetratricopeptide repeat protein [Bacteroidetes bacterium]|nr:tetratricopeptide repeat protein [Bacteroidota bacterium]